MLKDEIDEAKRSVSTETVQITIGEVANMYTQSELNIIPEFQRLFRWTPERKSNFVESILIGIPIPPVFVYENADGTWELIDGLQRISTVLEFMGVLRDQIHDGFLRSKLIETKYLPSLRGVVWEKGEVPIISEFFEPPDSEDDLELEDGIADDLILSAPVQDIKGVEAYVEPEVDPEKPLDKALQLFFRRHRIDFQILKYPSDPKTKFDLFQRLNRGGAYANEQEVRTCSMVLANSEFTRALRQFSSEETFQKIFQITKVQRQTQKDFEYAVRAVVHTFEEFKQGRDVQEFLDGAILKIMTERDPGVVIETVGWSIDKLRRILGDKALNPPANTIPGIANRFSLRALEGIVVGISRNRGSIENLPNVDEYIRQRVVAFWNEPEVLSMATPGLRGTVRLQRTVAFGDRWFRPHG